MQKREIHKTHSNIMLSQPRYHSNQYIQLSYITKWRENTCTPYKDWSNWFSWYL